jgi:hypothetical protein
LALAIAIAAPASAHSADKPSLAVSALAAPPSKVAAGAGFDISGTVTNSGNRSKRARVRAFMRPAAGGDKVQVGSVRTRRVATKRDFTIDASVPAELAAGDYDLKVCVLKRASHGPRRCQSAPLTVTGQAGGPPNFTPGARSLSDPLLPQIGNGGYDAEHYDISLNYDPVNNNFISASTTMKAVATQDLSELSLDFQDLPVDKVLVNRAAATFSRVDATPVLAGGGTQPMKLVIDPPTGIVNGATFTVEVDYHGQPQVFIDPDGSKEGWIPDPTCPVPTTCSYFVVGEPMGSQAWFPSNNHPSDKASVDTQITVPSGNVGIGIGELIGEGDNGNGTTSFGWSEDSPTATYLYTATNGAFNVTENPSGFTEALTTRTIPVYDAVTPAATPLQTMAISQLSAMDGPMVDDLGSHYGPYPLDSYGSVWVNNPDVGYELEVQTKSHFSSLPSSASSVKSTYLHELSHQWWGDSITPRDWNDLWHSEGWAQLSQWIYQADAEGTPDYPAGQFDTEYGSPHDWSVPPATLDGDPKKMFTDNFPTYVRPAMMLEGFREIIGAGPFDDFARGLQTQFAHGNIDAPQFIAFAEQSSGFTGAELSKLGDYFQQWLFGTTKPTLTPTSFP